MPAQGRNTVLLVMDVQTGILDRLTNKDNYLKTINTLVNGARDNHIPVIFVVVGFRPGMPEVSDFNQSFRLIKDSPRPEMINPEPAITLAEGDVVVTKRRVSAFTGSDLEVILRAKNATHLVLSGISTSGVVLSTLREAADKDYELTVLSNATADMDSEVHEVLMTRVFPRQANVTTVHDWLEVSR
jgi:nicotinamidase-related amidase